MAQSDHEELSLPWVIANCFPKPMDESLFAGVAQVLPWQVALEGGYDLVEGIFMFGHELIDGAMMDRLPGLKVISNCGVGVDHIDLTAARARGIRVGNTPGVLDKTVADLAMTLLLGCARRLVEGDTFARSKDFVRVDHNYMLGVDVHGATLGIVGMGNIGTQIAKRALGFDMKVLYFNRSCKEQAEKSYDVRRVAIDELLRESDFVVLAVPLTDATRGLINEAAFVQMKSNAALINISRGPVVDTEALTQALKSSQIRAAALDVTDPEPLPRDHPLLAMQNVIITPHLGSGAEQTRLRMANLAVANLVAGLSGNQMPSEVESLA